MFRIARTLAMAFLVAVAATAATVLPAQATAQELPGGKANYVVSLGHLKDAARNNWVRLGTYEFDAATGTVAARMYLWEHASPKARVGTGTVPDASCATRDPNDTTLVRACEVKTAGGFTGSPTDLRTGVYELRTVTIDGVATPIVWISWNFATAWTEQWAIENGTDLARLKFLYNTKATTGYAYGSNAALTTRRAMTTVQAHPARITLQGTSWAHDVTKPIGGTFGHTQFRTCETTTWCLTLLQPSSSTACQKTGCPHYGGGTTPNITSIQYYLQKLANTDRRDTLWHWCTCLAMERNETCYTGNSHVKPMYQVIDDTGTFRGWVGVEASYWPNAGEDPRKSDMFAVYRMADWV
ncbi:hypothetical protein ABZ135_08525 [Streptomyces sp. NPDC006339]|uniref:hypothetical protein n=1 Tax=Streptomyces sp. NPDC006339 TaxID=3156755 RepID=UPI0033BCFD1F